MDGALKKYNPGGYGLLFFSKVGGGMWFVEMLESVGCVARFGVEMDMHVYIVQLGVVCSFVCC